ncbi:unnamed protein product, partial [Rotaria sordida]
MDRLHKPVIVVFIEKPGECDWFDIRIAGLKYIRFQNVDNQLER